MFHLVGDVESFPEAEAVPVNVAGRSLVIVKWRGELFAVRNVCPHQSQAFTPGRVRSAICGTDTVGEIELGSDEPVIVCPWHTWEFRLRDGRCPRDESKRVKSYTTEIRGDCLYVEVEGSAPAEREPAVARA